MQIKISRQESSNQVVIRNLNYAVLRDTNKRYLKNIAQDEQQCLRDFKQTVD